MLTKVLFVAIFMFVLTVARANASDGPQTSKAMAADGVELAYTAAGQGEPSLVFIHGGFANRSFWSNQLTELAKDHRVVAIDLAGHGDSGDNRKTWGIVPFAKDVQAVVEKENLRRVVILGNSLGGPVALEAARLMPNRAIGVVPVDTLQSLSQRPPADWAKQQAKAFREDFTGTMKKMVRTLLHPDTDPKLYAWVEKQMLDNEPETAAAMMESLGTYDFNAPLKDLRIPIRCINGDLYPTDIEGNRKVYGDFDAVVLKHIGHYPMLENPALFNQTLTRILKEIAGK